MEKEAVRWIEIALYLLMMEMDQLKKNPVVSS